MDQKEYESLRKQLAFISVDPYGERQQKLETSISSKMVDAALQREYLHPGSNIQNLTEDIRDLFKRPIAMLEFDGKYRIHQDMGSGSTIQSVDIEKATRDIFTEKDLQKMKLLFTMREKWEEIFNIDTGYESAGEPEWRDNYNGITISGSSKQRIIWTKGLLAHLPSWVFKDDNFKHALRGGIDVNAPRHMATRFGHYDDKRGTIGIQSTILSQRDFTEMLLHELGHALTSHLLRNRDLVKVYSKAIATKSYDLPMGGMSAGVRGEYIMGSVSEFLAESCMHYMLGHTDELLPNPSHARELKTALQKKVFKGYTYGMKDGKLRKFVPPANGGLKDSKTAA
jgi:hypothetical protein